MQKPVPTLHETPRPAAGRGTGPLRRPLRLLVILGLGATIGFCSRVGRGVADDDDATFTPLVFESEHLLLVDLPETERAIDGVIYLNDAYANLRPAGRRYVPPPREESLRAVRRSRRMVLARHRRGRILRLPESFAVRTTRSGSPTFEVSWMGSEELTERAPTPIVGIGGTTVVFTWRRGAPGRLAVVLVCCHRNQLTHW